MCNGQTIDYIKSLPDKLNGNIPAFINAVEECIIDTVMTPFQSNMGSDTKAELLKLYDAGFEISIRAGSPATRAQIQRKHNFSWIAIKKSDLRFSCDGCMIKSIHCRFRLSETSFCDCFVRPETTWNAEQITEAIELFQQLKIVIQEQFDTVKLQACKYYNKKHVFIQSLKSRVAFPWSIKMLLVEDDNPETDEFAVGITEGWEIQAESSPDKKINILRFKIKPDDLNMSAIENIISTIAHAEAINQNALCTFTH